jgi:hypothetical protein
MALPRRPETILFVPIDAGKQCWVCKSEVPQRELIIQVLFAKRHIRSVLTKINREQELL